MEWVTIVEHFFDERHHGGTCCALVDEAKIFEALGRGRWIGRDVGHIEMWDDGQLDTGLTVVSRDVNVEFFCQVRRHHGLRLPSVEVSPTFLWYWDAFERGGDWFYLDTAGRDQDLIRTEVADNRWRVEVRGLELRHYLADRQAALVVQFNYVPKVGIESFERVDAAHRSEWVEATWACISKGFLPGKSAFSNLVGQYAIGPLRGPRAPRFQEWDEDCTYVEFQYDVDPVTGEAMRHTCDPNQLGTYINDEGSRPHYLTPIYFGREVLTRYVNEPSRYSVTATRLTCLDLWGIDISTNTAGLVEVYLGDLGGKLPSGEWPHWIGHNVAPAGEMAEHRFRRDILNQFWDSDDLPLRVRKARLAVASASEQFVGRPVWRELKGPEAIDFERLHGPTSIEPRSLNTPVLTLTKVLIDAIDPAPLRGYLNEPSTKVRSLELVARLEDLVGGDGAATSTLRDLQRLRSSGGVAHLSGSNRQRTIEKMGISEMSATEAFDRICVRVSEALEHLAILLSNYRS